ncbi:hypothetical protein WL578_11170, partial [Staphylococcus epidermidis]
ALNIRKVTAQRAENNQKNNKKDNFYIISIEIVFFYLSWDFMSHTLKCQIYKFFKLNLSSFDLSLYHRRFPT